MKTAQDRANEIRTMSIADIRFEGALRPYEADLCERWIVAAHLRQLYTFIAQLQRQIDELKATP